MTFRRRIPACVEDRMISLYLAGASMTETGRQFGYSERGVAKVLRRRGVLPRPRGGSLPHYSFDRSFFDAILTESQAYWLGFLSADSGIVRNRLILKLADIDAEHLFNFKRAISAEHPVRSLQVSGRFYRFLEFHSEHLIGALRRLGVSERKSFALFPCPYIPANLLVHYWRGFVDGDGWISFHSRGVWCIGLSGTAEICEGFRSFIRSFVPFRATVRPCGRIFSLEFGGNRLSRSVASLLYRNAEVFLRRKMDKARLLLDGDLAAGH